MSLNISCGSTKHEVHEIWGKRSTLPPFVRLFRRLRKLTRLSRSLSIPKEEIIKNLLGIVRKRWSGKTSHSFLFFFFLGSEAKGELKEVTICYLKLGILHCLILSYIKQKNERDEMMRQRQWFIVPNKVI